MYNCIIIDDEPLAQQILQQYVAKTTLLRLIGTFSNAKDAFEFLTTDTVDLIFLDIKMPVLNGIDFIKQIRNPSPVIFTTAFSEYAIESYEVDAIDYLLKPITYERFEKAINKYFKQNTSPASVLQHTYFKVDGRLIRIEHDTLIYAQSIKDYIIIYTTHGNFITHMTMKYLSELLPAALFLRIHRSYLVGLKFITSLDNQKLHLGTISLPIGDSYKIDIVFLRQRMTNR